MQQALITREEIHGQAALIDTAGNLAVTSDAPERTALRRNRTIGVTRTLVDGRRVAFIVHSQHAQHGELYRGRIVATRTGWTWTDVDAFSGFAVDYIDAERALLAAQPGLDA